MNKNRIKWKNIKDFAHEPTAIWKNFIIKEGCQIGYQWQNANKVYIFKNFSWRLYYQSLSQNDVNCLQKRLETCGFADRNFFLYKKSWEVLFLLEEDYCPIPS